MSAPETLPIWKTMAASTMSGVFARFICHPLDTCKARLQASSSTAVTAMYENVWHVLRQTWRQEGLAGFYRGIGVSLVGSAPATCLYLTSYEQSKDWLAQLGPFATYPTLCHLTAGLFAEALSCVLWVPIDVTKERLQIQNSYQGSAYRGSWDAMRTVLKYEGLGGVYKGYGSTLASFGPYSALMFAFYENFKSMAQRTHGPGDLPVAANLVTGASAACLAALLTNPLDLVKLRLQIQRRKFSSTDVAKDYNYNYSNFIDGLRCTAREEGLSGFLKGADSRVLYTALMSACTFASYEWMKQNLREY